MHRLALAFLLGILPSCAAAPARTPAQPAPAQLTSPLDSLAFYVGSWQCKGTTFPNSEQKAETWDARIEVEPELDGKWLQVKMIGPGENRTVEHKGFDPFSKRWIHVAVGNDGSWVAFSSSGWNGASMVFDPAPSDGTHATFTKLSETSYSHVITRDAQSGQEKLFEKVCTKA
jgi:hypothetical protein